MRWRHFDVVRSRLRWVLALLGIAALCGLSTSGVVRVPPAARGPNVVLIVVDTLRADHLSLYGYERRTSPNIDRLGRGAWVFDKAFTVMSHTLPAHVSLMTGLHPAAHQVLANGWRYQGESPTVAELLRAAGYRTGGFVSGIPVNGASGLARGFDAYFDTMTDDGRVRNRVAGETTTLRALEWLAEDAARPFFLFVHYFDTHTPYELPPNVASPFDLDDHLRQLVARRELTGVESADVLHQPITLNGVPVGIPEAINAYDNEIHRVDAQIGVLLERLAHDGRLANSLVVVTSDHGEGLGDHGYWSHGLHLYEEQIRIPLIVRPPGSPVPRRIERAASLLDVLPTIARFTPIVAPAGCSGRPLDRLGDHDERWLLAQRRRYSRDARARHGRFAANTTLHALRGDGQLKYLRSGDGHEELYDLADDPQERHDLASNREDDVAQLRELLDGRKTLVASSAPVSEPEISPAMQKRLQALGYL